MEYKQFNDYELLDQIHCCNEDANEILLYKYRPLIISIANEFIKYCHGGVDMNDLIQEGMLGFTEAINTFRNDKEANFGTYAKLCVRRKIISLVKSTGSNKNKILNESVSIEADNENSYDKFLIDSKSNTGNIVEEYTDENELISELHNVLTDFEVSVFDLKKEGFDYKEIAAILDKNPKSIDNALQRIKAKLKNILKK